MQYIDDLYEQCGTLEGRHAAAKEHGLRAIDPPDACGVPYSLQDCDDPECLTCGIVACPYREPLHFHHDGCPACEQAAGGHIGKPQGEIWPGSLEACTGH